MTYLIAITAAQAAIVGVTCIALLYDVHQGRKETKERGERRLELAGEQVELSMLEEVELREIRKALNGAEVDHGHVQ